MSALALDAARGPVGAYAAASVVAHVLLRLLPDLQPLLLLVPGYTVTRPWQLLTCVVCEPSLPILALGVAALALIHRAWEARELSRFLLLVGVLTACASWLAMVLLYILFRNERFLFTAVGGVDGAIAAAAVALKQQQLSGRIGSRGALSLIAAHAPSLALCSTCALVLLGLTFPAERLLLSAHGILISWGYLRYYQPQPGGCGDGSAAFAFAYLFPSPVRPPPLSFDRGSSLLLRDQEGCCRGLAGISPTRPPRARPATASAPGVSVSVE